MIYPPTTENTKLAAKNIREGELVAFPTETVYGVGADASNPAAVKKIFIAKGRPLTNPLIVHVAGFDQLMAVADIPGGSLLEKQLLLLKNFWPGPLSVVVPKSSSVPDEVTAGRNTVAVRIPAHPVALALLNEAGVPIAAPSANQSEYVSPTSAEHVESSLGDHVAMILDGGPCSGGLESTILSLVDSPPRILRPGLISAEILGDLLGPVVVDCSVSTGPALAPGQGLKHYSPRTPLIVSIKPPRALPGQRIGLLAFRAPSPLEKDFSFATVARLSSDGNLIEAATKFYSALRDLDNSGLDLIVAEPCEETGVGLALMDRLRRAATVRKM